MNLKAITTRKAHLRSGLLFWITIEIENHNRHIYRCVVDIEKGAAKEDVARKFENLAREIRDT